MHYKRLNGVSLLLQWSRRVYESTLWFACLKRLDLSLSRQHSFIHVMGLLNMTDLEVQCTNMSEISALGLLQRRVREREPFRSSSIVFK